jgi:hypothetical protein
MRQAALATLILLSGALPAAATTTAAPACLALHDKCLAHVQRRNAAPPAADGIERPHLTENECYDSYHAAQKSGVWPEHLPFNFAIDCAN